MSQADVLPDSRLKDQTKGSIMMNWPLADGSGRFVRIEAVAVFCANCGKPHGYVPKDNTSWAFWLCENCFQQHGAIAGTYSVSDDEFNRKVQEEMQARFGRVLSADEIAIVADQGQFGTPLELLMRESPYKVFRGE